jgi:tetratricopeptide (TPR) repeat protein
MATANHALHEDVCATGYGTRDAARLLGLTEAQVRACVKAGTIEPRRDARGAYRFSFQDLVVLRAAKTLLEHFPARRVRKALAQLRAQLPRGRALAGVRISARGDDIIVHDGREAWEPESGQVLLDLDIGALVSEAAPIAQRAADAAQRNAPDYDSEDWFELACDMETFDTAQARDAYRRALELDPEHFDARVNLGRLLHEAGEVAAAEANYRVALRLRPGDATAAFNLGVALEDLRRPEEALGAYERAIAADPDCADAHYNLAHLYERLGKPRNALRHLQAYRTLQHTP